MARTRNIKHGFFRNEQLADCDPLARLLFAGMWTIADREGRLEDRPKRIKADVLPYDNCDVDTLLNQLARGSFILRYQVNGQGFIQIATWNKHQQCHVNEAASVIPPPEEHQLSTVQVPEEHGSNSPLTNMLTALTDMQEDIPAPALEKVIDNFTPMFDEIWATYPDRNGKKVGKEKLKVKLRAMSLRDLDSVLIAVRNYAASSGALKGYARDPVRFMEADYWREWLEPERMITNGPDRPNGTTPNNGRSATATNSLPLADLKARQQPGFHIEWDEDSG